MLKNGKSKPFLKPIENKLKINMDRPCLIKVIPLESSPNKQIAKQVKFNVSRSKSRASFSNSKTQETQMAFVRQGNRTRTQAESIKINCEEKQNSAPLKFNSKNSLVSSKKLRIILTKIIEEDEESTAFTLTQPIFQESSSQIQSYVEELFKIMIQLKHCRDEKTYIKMKKEKLTCFILFILSYMSNSEEKQMTYCPEEIIEILKKIKMLLTPQENSDKKFKVLSINSIMNEKIHPQDFKESLKDQLMCISKLVDQKVYLTEQIQQIRLSLQSCSQQLRKSQEELDDNLRNSSQIKQKADKLTEYLDQISTKITGKEQYMANLEEEVKNITYFSENQKEKPQLMEVSKQYKRIEQQLFDYGYELECRPELSSFTWEPKPFRLVEEYIMEDMEHINRDLLDSSIPQEQKFKDMQEFVLSSIRKFKRKDEQMMSVVKTKTEAIVQFISKLKMWLHNHEVKHTFLQRLKKQFAAYSSKINIYMEQFLSESSSFKEDELEKMKEMQKYWKYVEQNYKLGNSFY